MGALPIFPEPDTRRLPDYLPARMVNEFIYCPRLFFYEWVEGVFRESADTVEGKAQHGRVDAKSTGLPTPEEAADEEIHSRSVTLSSERLRVIAKLDLLEGSEGIVTPVDYKHGRPIETDRGLDLWPTDRVQLGVQGLILRENGYRCVEGVAYYSKTKQRVRVVFDDGFMRETEEAIAHAWEVAAAGIIPPPLEDSPKCGGCSLVGICLPDETSALRWSAGSTDGAEQLALFEADGTGVPRKPVRAANQVRRLIAPRDELRPVYLNTQGVRVGKSGEVLQVREAVQTLCEAGVPVCYFSQGGWFYGITSGLNAKNVFLRKSQFRLAEEEWFALSFARQLVSGKIRNQRTMLQRNHIEPRTESLVGLKQMIERAEGARGLDELLGIEGNAARIYFGDFAGMIKTDEANGASAFPFDFNGRNRRPPRDAVNALLSLAYSLLAKDLTIACYGVGFDPFIGYYHQPRFGRPALALDLMEPFRPLVADSAVLSAINTGMVTARDFVRVGPSVALTAAGRKGFFRAYELRMDTLVSHPLFDYRVTYRRLLEIQARLFARVLEGEIGQYPVFVTR